MFVSSLTMAAAQQVGVEAKIDSVAIMIGEQAHLQLTITARQGAKIVYPHYKRSQYLVPGVEVLDDTKGDTAVVDGYWSVKKILTLTSFDEQLYAIPGITVKVDGKNYKSNPVAETLPQAGTMLRWQMADKPRSAWRSVSRPSLSSRVCRCPCIFATVRGCW